MAKAPVHISFYPSDWLAGTRGMTAAETGVYITLIAMMYERGEPLDMDRARLSRLCGIPAGSFVRVLDSLRADGKIIDTEAGIWNARVERELGVARQKSGIAKAAANSRWQSDHHENLTTTMHSEKQISEAYTPENLNENNDTYMQTQCGRNANQNQNQNQIEEDGGGSSAREKNRDSEGGKSGAENGSDFDGSRTFRERVLIAAKHDPQGWTATGKQVGDVTDMMAVTAWQRDLGLSEAEIVSVIESVAGQPKYKPVWALKYFDGPMQRLAGAKSAPKLAPIAGQGRAADTPQAETRQQMAHRVLARLAAGEDLE